MGKSATVIYGIKNCDSVKKARKWLEKNCIEYAFHDIREDGLSKATIDQWSKATDWETLLNRRSTTWKQLPQSTRDKIDKARALAEMEKHPTLIKRPVLKAGKLITVGFSEKEWSEIFQL